MYIIAKMKLSDIIDYEYIDLNNISLTKFSFIKINDYMINSIIHYNTPYMTVYDDKSKEFKDRYSYHIVNLNSNQTSYFKLYVRNKKLDELLK